MADRMTLEEFNVEVASSRLVTREDGGTFLVTKYRVVSGHLHGTIIERKQWIPMNDITIKGRE